MSSVFTFILYKQDPNINYVPGKLQENLLNIMNKYSLFSPYIIHRNQTVLLSTIGLDYLYDPDNFASFTKRIIIILFSPRETNIGQYFYRSNILGQNKIYFNALNNYSQQFIYTNVAASVKTDKNTVEKIYSINGLPLSFINDSNVQYSYEGLIAIPFFKKLDNGLQPSYPYLDLSGDIVFRKYGPNGKKQFPDHKGLLWFGPAFRDYTFDKLLIYNMDKRCKYLLINNLQKFGAIPIDGSLNVCSVYSATDTLSSDDFVQLAKEPYLFNLPITVSPQWISADATSDFGRNSTDWAIASGFRNIVNLDNDTPSVEWDCILGSNTPLYGNNTLKITDYYRVYKFISFADLIKGGVNNAGVVDQNSPGYIYNLTLVNENEYNETQVAINYKHISNSKNWPTEYITYIKSTNTWLRLPFSQTNTYCDTTFFIWENDKFIQDQFDIPSDSCKVWMAAHSYLGDYITTNNYILTTRDCPVNWTYNFPYNDITYAMSNDRKYQFPGTFSPRLLRTSEFCVWPIMNITSSQSYNLNKYWNYQGNIFLSTTGITGDTLYGKYMNPAINTTTSDINAEDNFLFIQQMAFKGADLQSISYHAMDETPFSEGIRITRPFFNYKQYFQMKYFPYFVVKKSFDLENDMDLIDNAQGIRVTKPFELNTLEFLSYTEIALLVLPTLQNNQNTRFDFKNDVVRGLSLKCSLSRRVRGKSQYLFLEQGNRGIINFMPLNLASFFDFAIYYPPNKTDLILQTTLFRQIDETGASTNGMTIYMLFK